MLTFKINRLKVSFLTCLTLASISITSPPLKAQTPTTPENPSATPTEDLSDPNNLRPLTQSDSILSLKGGQKLMSEAKTAIDAEQYDVAAEQLQKARQVFNQLSNFYLQLFDSFSGIDNRIAEGQRKKALETGQMRDEATYQLALVHRAQNQPELSVPLLIQVVKSQNPTTELGKKAYQQLFEIGFVEDSFPTSNSAK